MRRLRLWAVFIGLLGIGGCDDSFSPFVSHDRYFSMYGTFDAAADTNFVRITPIRLQPSNAANPLEAKVYLENTADNTRIPLAQQIRQTTSGEVAHLFWTTAQLKTGVPYLLVATNAQNQTSSARFTLSTEPINIDGSAPWNNLNPTQEFDQTVVFYHPKHLVRFRAIFSLIDQRTKALFQRTYFVDKTTFSVSDHPAFSMSATSFLKEIAGTERVSITHLDVESVRVEAVVSSEPLPDVSDLETYAIAERSTNVTNGYGWIAPTMTFKTYWNPLTVYLQTWLRARKDWRN